MKTGKKLNVISLKLQLRKNLETTVVMGEAAFYGPKLDFMVKDAIGQEMAAGNHPG